MADAVTSQTIVDNDKTLVMKFTNISDGSGESAVKKVDVSALNSNGHGQACTSVTIDKNLPLSRIKNSKALKVHFI